MAYVGRQLRRAVWSSVIIQKKTAPSSLRPPEKNRVERRAVFPATTPHKGGVSGSGFCVHGKQALENKSGQGSRAGDF